MKAIITGATSGLGRNLVEFLKEKNYEIIAMGRNEKIGKELGVKFKSFDLSDLNKTLENFENSDVVFHCSALSSPWGKYEDFYKSNVISTENVIKAMEKYNIKKIIHVSTPTLYFDYTDKLNIKEEDIVNKFVNYYAETKHKAEEIVLNSNFNSVIIRPRGIFGEYDQVLVPRIEKIAKKGYLPIIKNKEVIIDITYVGNVVYALYLAAEKDIPTKEIFNITNDEPQNIRTIFNLLMNSLNKKVLFKEVSYKKLIFIAGTLEILSKLKIIKEPIITKYGIGVLGNSQTLNIEHAKNLLGYKPLYTIEEGLKRYEKYRNI